MSQASSATDQRTYLLFAETELFQSRDRKEAGSVIEWRPYDDRTRLLTRASL
jgi:hypothetical protein